MHLDRYIVDFCDALAVSVCLLQIEGTGPTRKITLKAVNAITVQNQVHCSILVDVYFSCWLFNFVISTIKNVMHAVASFLE